MSGLSRARLVTGGVVLLIVGVIAAAFALGGSNGSLPLPRSQGGSAQLTPTEGGAGGGRAGDPAMANGPAVAPRPVAGPTLSKVAGSTAATGSVPGLPATSGSAGGGAAGAADRVSSTAHAVDAASATGGVAATRVVKTGSLSLTVRKGEVGATIVKLTEATTRLGGYVAQSRSDDTGATPSGSLTLRIPVNQFESAITAATALGHQASLTTNAHDVTGRFVDLNARLSALKRTRATYLTILSRARTIGQTLSVQQRVNDIQQQIEQLQGQLKVLRNQSSDATLTVDVSEVGSPVVTATHHHHRSGWSKAWHTSTGRFNRGIQTIIGGLGPLLLALLLLGLAFVVAKLALRRSGQASKANAG